MGARARLLALAKKSERDPINSGTVSRTQREEDFRDGQGRGAEAGLGVQEQAEVGRWCALALGLLQLAKADLLAQAVPQGPHPPWEENSGVVQQAALSREEEEGEDEEEEGEGGNGEDEGEHVQAAQSSVQEGGEEAEVTLNHPGMLASFALVAGLGASTSRVGGAEAGGGSEQEGGPSCVWLPEELEALQSASVDGGAQGGQRKELSLLLQSCSHAQVLRLLASGLGGSGVKSAR